MNLTGSRATDRRARSGLRNQNLFLSDPINMVFHGRAVLLI